MTLVAEQLEKIQERIRRACANARRRPEEVTLVLVTKFVEPERIREAYDAGCRDFGENRVQELAGKHEKLPGDIRWHLVGHLQTNKVKLVLRAASLIHSLDRLHLAAALEKEAEKASVTVPLLLQVNTSQEDSKFGLRLADVKPFVERAVGFTRLRLSGLMTIGPLGGSEAQVSGCFRELRTLREQLKTQFPDHDWPHLSMGMSGDFEWAIEEGATLVRIGRAVFGERTT